MHKKLSQPLHDLMYGKKAPVIKNEIPPKPEGWFSGKDMAKIYVGDAMKHNRTLNKFAVDKKNELIKKGETVEEADKIVLEKWVRKYKSGITSISICASPETIAKLEETGLVDRKDNLPPKPEGWVSNCDMYDKYQGSAATYKKIFLAFAEEKKLELINSGIDENLAAQTVQKEWIGRYRCGALSAICASPQAIKELEKRPGVLIKREKTFAGQVGENKPDISPRGIIKARSSSQREL